MHSVIRMFLATVGAASSVVTLAQTGSIDTALKAASCNACHGPYGRSQAGIPTLESRSADNIYTSLKEFASGRRAAFVMQHHAKGYSDQEMREIAAYFAQTKSRGAAR